MISATRTEAGYQGHPVCHRFDTGSSLSRRPPRARAGRLRFYKMQTPWWQNQDSNTANFYSDPNLGWAFPSLAPGSQASRPPSPGGNGEKLALVPQGVRAPFCLDARPRDEVLA